MPPRSGRRRARLSEIWRAKQLEYSWVLSLARRYEPFWLLTERALDYAFARCPGVDRGLRAGCSSRLPDASTPIRRFAGTLDVAAGARACAPAILSNGDLPMLRDAVASAGLADRLDPLLSVDAVKVFKTSPRAYELAPTALAPAPGRDRVRVVEPLGHRRRGGLRLPARSGSTALGLPDEYPGLAPDGGGRRA